MSDSQEQISIMSETSGERIDVYVANYLSSKNEEGESELDLPIFRTFSRSSVQHLIEDGRVLVEGKLVKSNYKLKNGEEISICLPEPEILSVEPENIPLDVVYEDSDIVVINKPRGMVVHPAAGNQSGTLVNALLYHCKDLSDINGVVRPGIVHRIDKDTTGLICVAKNNQAHLSLASQLETHAMARTYYAVVEGRLKESSGTIDSPIGRHPVDRKKMASGVKNGKEAVTHFRVLEEVNGFSLLRLNLETGRTHQIRVHLASIGHPITGDPLYGIKNLRGLKGQLLHAGQLTLTHPSTNELVNFKAGLPDDFKAFLKKNGFSSDSECYFKEEP